VIVEIKGAQFANQGAHLMLLATLERLAGRRPAAQFALAPGPHSPYESRARLGALQKLPLCKGALDLTRLGYAWPRAVDAALARYGIVTEARVDAVLDISGFAYGERWGDAALARCAAELERFGRRHKPYLFLPQAFGPFGATAAARRFGLALGHAALVCARDEASQAHLAGLPGAPAAAIERWPDLTIGLRGDPAAAARWGIDAATALILPNVRMLDSGPAASGWREGYVALLVALADACRARGRTPRIVNHGGAEDRALCRALAAGAGGLDLIEEPDPRATKGLIGAAGVVVSSRFHGCVAALSQGVPCLATSWSHKYGALFADFGVPGWVAESADAGAAVARLSALLDAPRPAALAARREALAARVDTLWERVFKLLPPDPAG
jgi:colanic acid/amylovoran biosynthesis protein